MTRDSGMTEPSPEQERGPRRVYANDCPTGALHFRRLDGGEQEAPQAKTTVEPRPNGPLFVRGWVRIVDDEGRLIREDTRLALCRCGASANKPFCDGSHRRIGFTTRARRHKHRPRRHKQEGSIGMTHWPQAKRRSSPSDVYRSRCVVDS